MGDSDRRGGYSVEVNKQDSGKSYKTGIKIDKKGDKITVRKLLRE